MYECAMSRVHGRVNRFMIYKSDGVNAFVLRTGAVCVRLCASRNNKPLLRLTMFMLFEMDM